MLLFLVPVDNTKKDLEAKIKLSVGKHTCIIAV